MITRSRSRSTEGTPVAEDNSQASSVSDSAPLEEVEPKPRKKRQGRGRGLARKQDQWVCLMPRSFLSSSVGEQTAAVCPKSIVPLKNPSSSEYRPTCTASQALSTLYLHLGIVCQETVKDVIQCSIGVVHHLPQHN